MSSLYPVSFVCERNEGCLLFVSEVKAVFCLTKTMEHNLWNEMRGTVSMSVTVSFDQIHNSRPFHSFLLPPTSLEKAEKAMSFASQKADDGSHGGLSARGLHQLLLLGKESQNSLKKRAWNRRRGCFDGRGSSSRRHVRLPLSRRRIYFSSSGRGSSSRRCHSGTGRGVTPLPLLRHLLTNRSLLRSLVHEARHPVRGFGLLDGETQQKALAQFRQMSSLSEGDSKEKREESLAAHPWGRRHS